ncbi:ATP-binding protein [Pseudomonas sp. DWP1b1]|uniref:ATP-binding protein n=2 Tax=Pseudomonas TaxID=286 RepID=UPI003CE81E28
MRYRQSTVGKLEKVSLRLSFGLLIMLLLVVFFAVTGYWVTYKVIRGEVLKVDYHFMRLVSRASDHEVFLLRVIKASSQLEYKPMFTPQGYVTDRWCQGDLRVYEGQSSQFPTTFSAALPIKVADVNSAVLSQQLQLAIALSNVHGDFWRGTTFKPPQMFLFDPLGNFEIAVPSINVDSTEHHSENASFSKVLAKVKQATLRLPARSSDLIVRWSPAQHFMGGKDIQQILGYVSGRVEVSVWEPDGPPRELVAATLLNWDEFVTQRVRIEKQYFDLPLFDAVDIVAPDGTRVVGDVRSQQIYLYENGVHLTSSGLLIKRSAGDFGTWRALYRISYEDMLLDARWQLFGLLGLLILCAIFGWSLSQWYRRRIVVPASNDFRELLVNHDFNHSLLQTVPLALCVVKWPGIEPVTQNSLYLEWLGDPADFEQLMEHWPLFEQASPLSGEGCMVLGARALYVRYTPTEYQGESVLLCTFTDISTHREATASMLRARKAADAANAQKSHFVATLSHELRTPLYSVLGTLELLSMTSLDERQSAYLRTIDSSSALLLHLISDVLDLSKIEAGQLVLESVAFAPLEMLEETVRGFSAMAAAKGLVLYCCIDPRVPALVQGDRLRIQQVVGNLLSNAIKFTETGHVAVFLAPSGSDNDARLQWRVVDTGPGMTEEVLAQLFERFYQANRELNMVAGTGLGLSICTQLSHLMQGRLIVDSTPGEGSEFVFELKLDTLETTRPPLPALSGKCIDVHTPYDALTDNLCAWFESYGAQTCVMAGESSTMPDVILQVMPEQLVGTCYAAVKVFAQHDFSCIPQFIGHDVVVNQTCVTGILHALTMAITGESAVCRDELAPAVRMQLGLAVLVAEDNLVNQILIKEQLERIGCLVDVVPDGAQALRQLDVRGYDVLLTDVNMPIIDGYTLTETLRQRDSDIPIIGITANALREEGERCIRAGMNSWLSKPMDIQGLYLCLRSVFDPDVLQVSNTLHLSDDLHVPARMLELFLQTIAQDLAELKALGADEDDQEAVRLLHRVRGALAVGKAKVLIQAARELEAAVARDGFIRSSEKMTEFIQRVGEAVARL